MSDVADIATSALLLLGGFFLFAGTVGLLRFPDVHSRLHALSKADNLGLGLIAAGLMLQAESMAEALKIHLWFDRTEGRAAPRGRPYAIVARIEVSRPAQDAFLELGSNAELRSR